MGALRLGVLGGTFNPIHRGHLHIADRARRMFDLSQVHFVVAAFPPHKSPENFIPLVHRYAMVSLATSRSPSFVPSLAELDPPSSPFSVHTLRKLTQSDAGRDAVLYFVAGGDSLFEVTTWHESADLLSSYNFIFVTRPGYPVTDLGKVLPACCLSRVRDWRGLGRNRIRYLLRAGEFASESRIFIVDAEAPDISATQIRTLASRGKRIGHLVPSPVERYIQKLHLYGER